MAIKFPTLPRQKNTHFAVGAGYDYEVINTEILLSDLSFKDGKLALSNGATFSVLALENEASINPLVLVKLQQLVDQGAMIVGARPAQISAIKDAPLTQDQGDQMINQLWNEPKNPSGKGSLTGQIHAQMSSSDLLRSLQVGPDFNCEDKDSFLLDYIHYEKGGLHFYFISNTSDEWVSRECGFRQESSVPEIWDPVSGEIIPLPVFKQHGAYLQIPLTFPPFGSHLIAIKPGNYSPQFSSISDGKKSCTNPWSIRRME
jgi:hypothetical protein